MKSLSLPRAVVGLERTLRMWDPSDGPQLDRVVEESLPGLADWLPWARTEPLGPKRRREQLRVLAAHHLLGENGTWGIRDQSGRQERLVGGAGLHPTPGGDGWMVGYWVGREHEGRGHATWAGAVVARTALEHLRLPKVEVHCDVANRASLEVVKRLGARPVGVEERRAEAPRETGRVVVHRLGPEDLPLLQELTGPLSTL